METFSSKSGCGRLQELGGRLQEVPNTVHDMTFGILENWSPRRGGHLREVVATEGSTVSFSFERNIRYSVSISRRCYCKNPRVRT